MVQLLNEFQNKYFLTQMVHQANHKVGNTLDLLFTNNQQLINEINCLPSKFSDHFVVEISSHFKSHFAKGQESKRQYTNTFDSLNFFSDDINWDLIKSDLQNVEWEQVLSDLDPEEKLNCFILTCESISLLHAPKKKTL